MKKKFNKRNSSLFKLPIIRELLCCIFLSCSFCSFGYMNAEDFNIHSIDEKSEFSFNLNEYETITPFNCANVSVVTNNSSATLIGIGDVKKAKVEIIGKPTGWQVVSVCDGDCTDPMVIDNLAGQYTLKIQLWGNDGSYCYTERVINVEDCQCITLFDPVCGIDGKTYSNECEANCAGVAIASSGACNQPNSCPILPLFDIGYSCDDCIKEIALYEFEGNNYIVLLGDNTNCSDALTTVHSCETGDVFCQEGGIAGFSCGNFFDVATKVQANLIPIVPCNPQPEICDNGIDDDGDGLIDTADPDCINSCPIPIRAYCLDDFPWLPNICQGPTPTGRSVYNAIYREKNIIVVNFDDYCGAIDAGFWAYDCDGNFLFAYGSELLQPHLDNFVILGSPILPCDTPQQEICNNGIDDDGDGLIDTEDPDCINSCPIPIRAYCLDDFPWLPNICQGPTPTGRSVYNAKYREKNIIVVNFDVYCGAIDAGFWAYDCDGNFLFAYGSELLQPHLDNFVILGSPILPCDSPQQEICDNGIDDDGDGFTDCADSDCNSNAICNPTKVDCSKITTEISSGSVTVRGLSNAQRAVVEIIGASTGWQVNTICAGNCTDPLLIDNLSGVYTLKIQLWGNDGSYCYTEINLIVQTCICPEIYQPVCGVDGKTYSNSCEAECAGVAIASQGTCNSTQCLEFDFNPNLCEQCLTEVAIYNLEGKNYLAFLGDNINCSDALTTVMSCETGETFCMEGGIAGFSCGNFFNVATKIETILKKDCGPVIPKTETNCSDGIDNDGDGFIDGADSDCIQSCPDNICLSDLPWLSTVCSRYNSDRANPEGAFIAEYMGKKVILIEVSKFCDDINFIDSEYFEFYDCQGNLLLIYDTWLNGDTPLADLVKVIETVPSCNPDNEICDNGIDDDGDGFIDTTDPDCINSCPIPIRAYCLDDFPWLTDICSNTTNTGNSVYNAFYKEKRVIVVDFNQYCGTVDAPNSVYDCDGNLLFSYGYGEGFFPHDTLGKFVILGSPILPCDTPQPEICDNNIDDDGDGLIDGQDPDCINSCPIPIRAYCLDDFPWLPTCQGITERSVYNAIYREKRIIVVDCGYIDVGPSAYDCDGNFLFTYHSSFPQPHLDNFVILGSLILPCDNPQQEICNNGIDDDGDGLTDCNDSDCVNVTVEAGTIIVTGLAGSDYSKVEIIGESTGWNNQTVCNGNCNDPLVISSYSGEIFVKVLININGNYCYTVRTVNTTTNLINTTISNESREVAQLNFYTYFQKQQVKLEWLTNTGWKNDYFEIERSIDGVDFKALERIENTKIDDELAYFNTIDRQPLQGINHYRVKQVYGDGSFDYTKVQKVAFWDIHNFSVFPNPVENEVFVNLQQFTGQKGALRIHNQYGQLVKEVALAKIPTHPVKIEVDNFQNGFYLLTVQLENNHKLLRKKLIVTKIE